MRPRMSTSKKKENILREADKEYKCCNDKTELSWLKKKNGPLAVMEQRSENK
jgi:hypothetical protein